MGLNPLEIRERFRLSIVGTRAIVDGLNPLEIRERFRLYHY